MLYTIFQRLITPAGVGMFWRWNEGKAEVVLTENGKQTVRSFRPAKVRPA